MKKLKYLLFLFTFLLITDVSAAVVTPSSVYATFNDDTVISSSYYVSNDGNYFASNTLLGGVSYQQWIKAINFYYSNSNLCSNQQLTINGKLLFTNSFFQNESYNLFVNNNNSAMSCSTSLTTTYSTNDTLNFSCVGIGGGSLSVYFHQSSYSSPRQYGIMISRDLQYSCDVSNSDIITSQNQNTQSIINNQDSNTQDIINNNSENTQDIINNQNQNKQDVINNQNSNTDKEIESQKVCSQVSFNNTQNIKIDGNYLNSSNSSSVAQSFAISDYTLFTDNATITTNGTPSLPSYCIYNLNKELISCHTYSQRTTIPISVQGTYYIRYSIQKSNNDFKFSAYSCQNGNQALNDSVNGLNSNITNSNIDNPSSAFSDFQNMLPENGVITQLITLPISLFQKILTSLNSSCSNFNLGTLYNHELILPCINVSNYVGGTLWNVIDILFSGFFVLVIAKKMIATFENFSSMKEGDILD